MNLHQGVMSWSVVGICDCEISWSYSLTLSNYCSTCKERKQMNKWSQSFVEVYILEILPAHSPKYLKIISRFPFVYTITPPPPPAPRNGYQHLSIIVS